MASLEVTPIESPRATNGYCACPQGFPPNTTHENVYCAGKGYRSCEKCCENELPNPIPEGIVSAGGSTGGTIGRPKPTLTGQPVNWRKASGFKRARRGGTGQAVSWRKQSGASEGGLFGLSTTQLLIAGAVGVGAYLILKKRKK